MVSRIVRLLIAAVFVGAMNDAIGAEMFAYPKKASPTNSNWQTSSTARLGPTRRQAPFRVLLVRSQARHKNGCEAGRCVARCAVE
jgi:hypothetical protein